ncbi:MAG: hypothetical protein L0211_16105, partial [Planctomycetaceae bacterium]|nr:hypothetical protein [Planctomycetaceae bacterium]
TTSRMDSKKTRCSADSSAVVVARIRISREAVCGRYLAFATRDVLRGRRTVDLAQAGLADALFGRRRLRQR